MEPQVVLDNELTTLKANDFRAVDMGFVCWNTDPEGDGIPYKNKSQVKLTEDLSLYAQWSKEELSVTFDGNTATSGTMDPQTVYSGAATVLKKNEFSKDGFVFAGWALTADGPVKYEDEEEIETRDNLTLYAKWIIPVTSVTLDQTSAQLIETKTLTLTATVLPSEAVPYNPVRWETSDSSVATVSESGVVTAVKAGKATITARAGDKSATCTVTVKGYIANSAWIDSSHVYGLTFDSNGSDGSDGYMVRTVFNSDSDFSASRVEYMIRNNTYIFIKTASNSWSQFAKITEDGNSIQCQDGSIPVDLNRYNETVTLTMKHNMGDDHPDITQILFRNIATPLLSAEAIDDYTFRWWNDMENGGGLYKFSGYVIYNLSPDSLNVFAQWTLNDLVGEWSNKKGDFGFSIYDDGTIKFHASSCPSFLTHGNWCVNNMKDTFGIKTGNMAIFHDYGPEYQGIYTLSYYPYKNGSFRLYMEPSSGIPNCMFYKK